MDKLKKLLLVCVCVLLFGCTLLSFGVNTGNNKKNQLEGEMLYQGIPSEYVDSLLRCLE